MSLPITSVTPNNLLNTSLKPLPAAAPVSSAPATAPNAQGSSGTIQPPSTSVAATINSALAAAASLQSSLGAFQSNTLQANATNLQSALNNATSANSVVPDTDYAKEIANFTNLQTQLQAGATVLSQANSTNQLIAKLLGS